MSLLTSPTGPLFFLIVKRDSLPAITLFGFVKKEVVAREN